MDERPHIGRIPGAAYDDCRSRHCEGGRDPERTEVWGNRVWLAPPGTTTFTQGPTMTKASGDQASIPVPATARIYKLSIVDSKGMKSGEAAAQLRVK